jgi:hypothetical protein
LRGRPAVRIDPDDPALVWPLVMFRDPPDMACPLRQD